MRSSKALLGICTLVISTGVFAQFSEDLHFDDNYYLFPIKPGVTNTLAGTMGELRATHFHAGIDIRTEGRIGLVVHAAAGGYISRAAVSPTGYGNALYIQHPNGQTTVYAHLEKFKGPVAEYVKKEQYRRKTFKINLYFRKGQFPVERGDTIALAGNSGSSGGPHLHFDIRDANQRPLNPLTYGFNEVKDHIPPVALKLAVKTLDIDARVEGQFGRKEYNLRRVGNDYVVDEPIKARGLVGIEILAHDKLDYSRFRCGINTIEMKIDSSTVYRHHISSFAFHEQRNILKHMNYHELATTGKRFHKLYLDDGNQLKFYETNTLKGKFRALPGQQHHGVITMTDSYGNSSKLRFTLAGQNKTQVVYGKVITPEDTKVIDNTLVITTDASDSSVLSIFTPRQVDIVPEFVANNSKAVYLWDLRHGVPRSVEKGDFYKSLDLRDMIPSQVGYDFFSEHVEINFPKNSLFDTVYFELDHYYDTLAQREIFKIGTRTIPLKKHINVTLRPQQAYQDLRNLRVFGVDGSGNLAGFVGGSWTGNKITFRTRNFGKFTLARDTVPPTITPVTVNTKDVKFKIMDHLSGIKDFVCTVNGQWVLMHYDYKRKLIWSEKLVESKPFSGEVKLVVTDNVNNKTEYKTQIYH